MLGTINGRSDPVIGKARSDTDTDTDTEQYYFCRGGKNQVSDTPEVLEDQGIESRP